MKTITKIVLFIIIITLVYSVVKLINASTQQTETVTVTFPITQSKTVKQNNQATQSNIPANTSQNTTVQNPQKLYHADEILIDGQGQAGQNYIDITSTTPITPQQQAQAANSTQSNTQNNSGGAYAQTSVVIDNNNNTNTSNQYAPGVPAFEVANGN